MSRSFPNTVLRRSLVAAVAKPVQFLRFAFGGGDVRITTAPFDIVWDGFTWQGIGGLLEMEALTESPDDRGGQFRIGLSGVDQSMLSAILAEAFIGRPVEVWMGWVALGTNLIGNSGFETNTSGYGGNGATLTRSQAAPPFEGDWCLDITLSDPTPDHGVSTINNLGADLPVVAGRSYVAACRVRVSDAAVPVEWRLFIDFYDSGINYLGSSPNTQKFITSGGWQEMRVEGTAPAAATIARPRLLNVQNQGTYTFFADAFQFGPVGDAVYQPTDGAPIVGGTVVDRPLFAFSGYMNGGFEVAEDDMGDREGQTVTIQGRVVSRLAALLDARGFRTNLESHQTVYRTDRFFEFVPGLAGRQVVWGWTKQMLLDRARQSIPGWRL